jgi:hypothetical protein
MQVLTPYSRNNNRRKRIQGSNKTTIIIVGCHFFSIDADFFFFLWFEIFPCYYCCHKSPPITIVKHFMDVSLYKDQYVIFDDEEEEGDWKTDFATSTTRAIRQKVEFEFHFNYALGS